MSTLERSPEYAVAAAALLRVASPFFYAAADQARPGRAIDYGVWLTLRGTAEMFLARRACALHEQERGALAHALAFAPANADSDYIGALVVQLLAGPAPRSGARVAAIVNEVIHRHTEAAA